MGRTDAEKGEGKKRTGIGGYNKDDEARYLYVLWKKLLLKTYPGLLVVRRIWDARTN